MKYTFYAILTIIIVVLGLTLFFGFLISTPTDTIRQFGRYVCSEKKDWGFKETVRTCYLLNK